MFVTMCGVFSVGVGGVAMCSSVCVGGGEKKEGRFLGVTYRVTMMWLSGVFQNPFGGVSRVKVRSMPVRYKKWVGGTCRVCCARGHTGCFMGLGVVRFLRWTTAHGLLRIAQFGWGRM